ncbi:DNA methyltransferase [Erythrobacter sp. R86502]|uniref:DNA methyltransferase n=1 Tax=Erythrobacter sp. R86502 TaxID=3093846 RepID=UPI0036D3F05A
MSLAGKGAERAASLSLIYTDEPEQVDALVADLCVVAEFRDYIYPGLVSTGKVERGGDKPFHTVINGENFHALEALTFTHRGKVDAIYIDPPYNSGATDWKYNNSYVEKDDAYRHSKWLAMIERRLLIARELLNHRRSILIVTIDAREYLRFGLLLNQIFPDARMQMVSSIINPKGVSVAGGFRRADEYLFFVMLGDAAPQRIRLSNEWSPSSIVSGTSKVIAPLEEEGFAEQGIRRIEPDWTSMMRRGSEAARADRESMFYPIYADPLTKKIVAVDEALPLGVDEAPEIGGLEAILPIRRNKDQGRWQISSTELKARIKQGRIRLGRQTSYVLAEIGWSVLFHAAWLLLEAGGRDIFSAYREESS